MSADDDVEPDSRVKRLKVAHEKGRMAGLGEFGCPYVESGFRAAWVAGFEEGRAERLCRALEIRRCDAVKRDLPL
jgi:ribosome modulation factor